MLFDQLHKNVSFWSVPAHIIFETSEWNTMTFGSQNFKEKGLLLSEPALKCITCIVVQMLYYLAILFIDEYNPAKIFKIWRQIYLK